MKFYMLYVYIFILYNIMFAFVYRLYTKKYNNTVIIFILQIYERYVNNVTVM